MKRIIGIDPGMSGALAFIDEQGRAIAHAVKHVSPNEAAQDALSGVSPLECVAYIERLTGYFGKTVPSHTAYKMGYSAGLWEGLFLGLGVRVELIGPKYWQKGISGVSGVSYLERKRALKAEAVRRFPSLKVTLDNCDALLIADYGRRVRA